jgi:hypothetical protein
MRRYKSNMCGATFWNGTHEAIFKLYGKRLYVYLVICLEINVKGVHHCYESGTRDGIGMRDGDRHVAGARASRSSTEFDRVGFIIGSQAYHSGVSDCVWVWVGLRLS